MSKFQVGDIVAMPGIPIPPVEVLEVRDCEADDCPYAEQQVFRFQDPGGMGEDWMHSCEFEKV